jgi:ABC-2 type transport system ATP-binding protein
MLELKQFRKCYGRQVVLEIPDARIPSGVSWIKGKNGSGKSTFFRCAAGISPFTGDLILNGKFHPRKHPVEFRMRVNYSEAEPLFPGFLCGREILEFVASCKKSTNEELETLISRLGLSLYFENPCGTYSSGMSKKLSLAMAFLGHPELIILDEPFITLDSESCDNLRHMIASVRDSGCGVLISSHPEFGQGNLGISQTFEIREGQLWNLS